MLKSILERKAEYELAAIRLDPTYKDQVNAIEIVKEFIITHDLIIYGGTALDYALRLHGDHIYNDATLEVPDLDFYSPKNIEHSYELADILFAAGYIHAHSRNAEHLRTMRVDLVDNHIIADISYQPTEIFDRIPTITYNNMRVVAPLFQRIDQHNALSFPYDNPPREVVFARWKKDVERMNKSAHYYPAIMPKSAPNKALINAPINLRHYVLSGDAAYSILYCDFILRTKSKPDKQLQLVPAVFENDKTIKFTGNNIELVHFDIKKCAAECNANDIKLFEPLGGIIPRKITCKIGDNDAIIYCSKNKLLSINSLELNGAHFRIVCVQYLLKHYLALYHYASDNNEQYLCKYISLLTMISTLEADKIPLIDTPFFLSTNTYGNENINLTKEIQLIRMYVDMKMAAPINMPLNYYPARSKDRRHPHFDPTESEYFRERGLEIGVIDPTASQTPP